MNTQSNAPQIYGSQHLTYLACLAVFAVVSIILFKKYVNPKYHSKIIKAFAVFTIVSDIVCRFAIVHFGTGGFWNITLIPDSWCSTSGFLLPLCILFAKKDSKILQFAMFAGGIGGLLTVLYPDFLEKYQHFFTVEIISSLFFHSGMLYLFALSLALGYFRPSMKRWAAFPTGLAFYFIWGGLNITYLGQINSMYLQEALLPGTIFNCYVTDALLIIVYTLFVFIYEALAKNKLKKVMPQSIDTPAKQNKTLQQTKTTVSS